jgi:hypothetical protein
MPFPVKTGSVVLLSLLLTFQTVFLAIPKSGGGDMMQLVGKNINSLVVRKWLVQIGNRSEELSSKNVWVFPEKGLRIHTEAHGFIEKIVIYGRKEKFNEGIIKPYSGYINDKIHISMTRRDVLERIASDSKDNIDRIISKQNGVITTVVFAQNERGSTLNSKIAFAELRYSPCVQGDCAEGYGVEVHLDGNRYEGQWKNRKYHGDGKKTYSNGSVKEGIWENGYYRGKNFFKSNGLYDLLGTNVESDKFKLFLLNQKSDYKKINLAYNYANMIFGDSKVVLFFNDKGNIYKFQLHKSSFSDYAKGAFNDNFALTTDKHYVSYLMGEPPNYEDNIWEYSNEKHSVKVFFNHHKTVESIEVKLDNTLALTENGTCKGDCINGFGEFVGTSGRYVGAFKSGKFDGYGSYDYTNNKQTYVGHFKNHQREGTGKLYASGKKLIYVGEWRDNEPNGEGKMYYSEKNYYVGTFANGVREGYGILYFKNGERFEGYWKNDLQNGKGVLYYNNGKKKSGFWENGKFIQ